MDTDQSKGNNPDSYPDTPIATPIAAPIATPIAPPSPPSLPSLLSTDRQDRLRLLGSVVCAVRASALDPSLPRPYPFPTLSTRPLHAPSPRALASRPRLPPLP
jgi:hypothetical protein